MSRWSRLCRTGLPTNLKPLPTLKMSSGLIPSPTFAQNHSFIDSIVSASPDIEVSKKKKKKRHHEDAHEPQDAPEKKKKRKKQHSEQEPDIQVQTAVDPALLTTVSTNDAPPVKRKKKKKDKELQPAAAPPADPVQIDDSNANPQAAAAALISAIVAAATGNSDSVPEHPQHPHEFQPQVPPYMPPHPQYLPYPFNPYPYGVSPFMSPNALPPITVFPPNMSLPFSEMTFGSNDDVLRALQALDMSKITSVLKTLGDAAAAVSEQSSVGGQPRPILLGQVPVASGAILGHPSNEASPTSRHRRTLDMSLAGSEHQDNPDHAYLLANKWLNAGKLSELARTEGLVYKKGKFSAIEEEQLRNAIENYRISKSLAPEHIEDVIFPKIEKNKDNAFWSEITAAVPQRPIIAVYHHVRRSYHPLKQQGKWTEAEDAALKQAVVDLGQQWEKVSKRVNRMSADCRDRYRNHIINKDIRVSGHWTPDEEEKLTQIVTDMTIKQGRDIDNDVFWGRVSELMGGTRGRQQCRIKWTDALSKTVKNEGQKPRWSQQDAYILVHKIDSLSVRDDTEIDWKTISDPQWNLWSAHTLQRRWLTMKRGIKGYEDMTHQEIMDILRVKKAQLPAAPPPSGRKRKERKVVSAAAIADADSQRDAPADSGSSPGPGTLPSSTIPTEQDSDEDESSDSE